MNSLCSIEKLDNDNYSAWALLMKSVLIQSDYWGYVTGKITPDSSETDVAKKQEALKCWQDKDSKALSTIILGLKPSQLIHVKYCNTSKAAWDALYNVHNPSGAAQKVTLLKQIARFKMNSNQQVSSQIMEFFQLVERIKEIQLSIPDELLCVLLLNSLPECFDNFTAAIESRDNLPSLNELKIKILEENNRLIEKDSTRSSIYGNEGILAVKYKQKRDQIENKSNKGNCFNCGKSGHFAVNCWRKKNKKGNQKQNKKTDVSFCTMVYGLGSEFSSDYWYLDSGATAHMCNNSSFFVTINKSENQQIVSATGETVKVCGLGTVKLQTTFATVTLKDVLYVPGLKGNFISVGKINNSGLTVQFKNSAAIVKRNLIEKILVAERQGGLFVVQLEPENNSVLCTVRDSKNDFVLWHKRYGHLNAQSLMQLKNREMVKGLDHIIVPDGFKCETCVKGKMIEKSFPKSGNRSSKGVLDLIHSDVCGPMRVTSIGGARYFITFVDDYSRKVYVRFLKNKSAALNAFKEFKLLVENQTGRRIKCVRSDNGKEYVNREFTDFLAQNGIKRQLSAPYSPQQNGVAERINRTLLDMSRCMLVESGLSESLWAEAVNTSAYIRNKSPSRILENKTPQELWTGNIPSVKHLRPFGVKAIVMKKGNFGSKFTSRGEEMILVGYSEESKAYRLYNPKEKSIIVSRDVEFFEDVFPFHQGKDTTYANFEFSPSENSCGDSINKGESEVKDEKIIPDDLESSSDTENSCPENQPCQQGSLQKAKGRPRILRTGKRGRPKKLFKQKMAAMIIPCEDGTPKTVAEALAGPNAKEWKKAMQVEYDSLMNNKTWELTTKPEHQRVIGSKWVFATKRDNNGNVIRHKARLVAQGFAQSYGIDYFDTSAPVVKASSVRLLFAVAAEMGYLLHHLDITSAYLHGELSETVYMKQPEGFVDARNKEKVCKLNKSLYGLKQAGKVWNEKLNRVLEDIGFIRCETDRCLYTMKMDNQLVYVAVYVDDLILVCQREEDMEFVKEEIGNRLMIQDKGPIVQYLNIMVTREGARGPIAISQERYIADILKEYNMENCKTTKTPLDPGMRFQKCTSDQCDKVDESDFRSLIGSLNYLAVWTRPDISCAVNKLAQFCNHPHKEHWKGALHILRYLRGTLDYKITYSKTDKAALECFVDADWGGEELDRKSYTGYTVHLANGLVTWCSKKQTTISLSSAEAEYTAISEATREILHVKYLLNELHIKWPIQRPIVIWNDNLSAQNIIKNGKDSSRVKHIDIKIHFVRDCYKRKEIDVRYLDTNSMKADILTKILKGTKHMKCVKDLNLISKSN